MGLYLEDAQLDAVLENYFEEENYAIFESCMIDLLTEEKKSQEEKDADKQEKLENRIKKAHNSLVTKVSTLISNRATKFSSFKLDSHQATKKELVLYLGNNLGAAGIGGLLGTGATTAGLAASGASKAVLKAGLQGGAAAAVAIVIICLVGLLVTSIFGIFFSSEKTSKNGITMKEVVAECNKEFGDKLETIQKQNPHDEYVLEGNMSSWKDVLLIYTIKQSNGINQQEVITVDNTKKALIKQIFWDMNEITSEVKTETVKASSVNTSDNTLDEQKRVLHIYVKSKTAEEMKTKYNFNPAQLKQYNELSDKRYASLWNNAIFGSVDSGEYVNWRQTDPQWSSIRVGNSSGTLGSIGCLITSISILIEKSGCNTMIKPFNPGTFLEALNKHNGFDGNGNLQYAAVTKAVPAFKYVGNVNLRGKSKDEKLSLIKQYIDSGYYITAEVKGATPGHQHWVAVTNVDGSSVIMVDPGSNQTVMWNAYNYEKTSQFNYFKVEG